METLSTQILHLIETLIAEVEESKETNEQWFLNFLDELNTLSVKY